MGVSKLLSWAIVLFVFVLDLIAVSMVATSWLSYDKSAAIVASCLMLVLIVVNHVLSFPLFLLAWYVLSGKQKTVKILMSDLLREDKVLGNRQSEELNSVLNVIHEEEAMKVIFGASLIHYLSYKHPGRLYRLMQKFLLQITLASGEDIEKESDNGTTPLMLAVLANNIDIVEVLLTEGSDPNRVNKEGYSALMFACQNMDASQVDTVLLLIVAGGDTSATALYEEEPAVLKFVGVCDDTRLLDMLLSKETGMDASNERFGAIALANAVQNGNRNIVKTLLKRLQLDINLTDSEGWTALMRTFRNCGIAARASRNPGQPGMF